ncbi:MAG: DHA2 family efflux MFS transporter permease subunit [Solirubrobacterales bacterium]|nr:DHA2 family efflux MFS transporter permease subunit [Solirubrobacterales bacterium]
MNVQLNPILAWKRPTVHPRGRDHGREWKVLLLSALAVFMVFVDVTIVNISFPAIRRTFADASLPDLSWVLNAYNVIVAALLLPAGRIADRVGRRRVFFVGLAVFLLGSVMSGAAPTAAVLIAARVVQAVGGAALLPASLGLVLEEFPAERRATATSAWAAAGAVAAATGPSLGGVLVESTSWRWAFFINLVIAIGMLPALGLLRETRDPDSAGAPDLFGAAMLVVAVGALALGIVKAPTWGWTSDRVLTAWLIAAAFIAASAVRAARHPAPVLEPAILRIRTFGTANAAFFVFSIGFYALLLGNILFLTQQWRYSLLEAGFAVTPAALVAAFAAAAGGRLAERFGSRPVVVPALLMFAGACLAYHAAGPRSDYLGHWLPAQILSGSAIGLTFAGLTSASVIDLPHTRLATGTAISSCFRQIGGVIGIAGLVAVLGTPGPRALMSAFEHAWLLMACTGAGAALLACGLPARRRSSRDEPAARRRPRLSLDLPGVARNEMLLHGHRLVYRVAGSGPPLLLVHGMFEDSLTWRKVIPNLARSHTVIAPDLFGHGESDAPPHADYSLGGHAGTLRDLLEVLGHQQVTIAGHSLGGGIAMSFAYYYPGRVRRMVLMSSGGFGREVHPLLRALSLPGAGRALGLLTTRPILDLLSWLARLARAAGARRSARKARRLELVLAGFGDRGQRAAMIRTLRSVIAIRGQSVSALHRLYALRRFPTLLVWGTRDRVIPAHHASVALAFHPDAELVLLDGVGHLPHLTGSELVAERVSSFINEAPTQAPIVPDRRNAPPIVVPDVTRPAYA